MSKLNALGMVQEYPTHAESIQTALDYLHPGIPLSEIEFEPMVGGMTSAKLYKMEVAGKAYVLKLLKPHAPLEERQREILAQKVAAEVKLAPAVVYADNNCILLIMLHIRSKNLLLENLKQPDVLKKAAQMIQTLHAIKPDKKNTRTPLDRANKHFQRAQGKDIAFPSCFAALYTEYVALSEKMNQTAADIVFCHGDLNLNNILITPANDLYFIDWPAATMGNKYLELGYFCLLGHMTKEQETEFLTLYLGRKPTNEELEKLDLAKRLTTFLTATVWFDFSETPEDKRTSKVDRIKSLDRLLEDPNLRTGLRYIEHNEIVSPTGGETEKIRLCALGFLKTYRDWGVKEVS